MRFPPVEALQHLLTTLPPPWPAGCPDSAALLQLAKRAREDESGLIRDADTAVMLYTQLNSHLMSLNDHVSNEAAASTTVTNRKLLWMRTWSSTPILYWLQRDEHRFEDAITSWTDLLALWPPSCSKTRAAMDRHRRLVLLEWGQGTLKPERIISKPAAGEREAEGSCRGIRFWTSPRFRDRSCRAFPRLVPSVSRSRASALGSLGDGAWVATVQRGMQRDARCAVADDHHRHDMGDASSGGDSRQQIFPRQCDAREGQEQDASDLKCQ